IDRDRLVEGEAQVLGERALARAVEARDPHTDLVVAARVHRELHAIEQLTELLVDVVGDYVLRDLRLEPVFLRRAVGDDLLDRPVDVLAGVEQRTDGRHLYAPELAHQPPTWTER